jgi:hypothetical protein
MSIKFLRTLLLLSMTTVILAACSSSTSSGRDQDPKDVKVELLTEGVQVKAGEETIIEVEITGLMDAENSDVQFEIRRSDNKSLPDLIKEVESLSEGIYTASYTFKKIAKYDVYVHIYNEDLHITKKKPLEVTG